MTTYYPGLSEEDLAAINEAARRDVASAPPLKEWQITILRSVCAPPRRQTTRKTAA